MITECSGYSEERNRLDDKFKSTLGQVWESRKLEDDKGVTTILGLREKNIELMRKTKEFLGEMWKKRKKKIIQISKKKMNNGNNERTNSNNDHNSENDHNYTGRIEEAEV